MKSSNSRASVIRMRPVISSPSKSDESSLDSSNTSSKSQSFSQSPHSSPQADFLSPSYLKQKHKIDQFSCGPSDSSSKADAKKIRLSTSSLSEFFIGNDHFRESDGLPRSWLDDMKPVFDRSNASSNVNVYIDAKRVSNSTSPPSLTSDLDVSPTSNIPNISKSVFADDFADLDDIRKGGKKPVADCNVCGDRAVAHMHYGGICCYSCKAFFRRASQTGNDKNYKCKKDENCVVSVANRRACQYCRFMKCLAIGMKPTWVLSDKQCQIRFRKGKGDGVRVVKIEDDIEEESKALTKIVKPLVLTFTTEEDKNVKRMCEKYIESKEMCSFSTENNALFKKLFMDKNTRSEHDPPYTAFDLSNLIMTVIKKNIFFLKSNQLVNDLDPRDMMSLITKNMSETCHLRGAIRFDSKSNNFVWYFNKQDTMQLAYQKPGCSIQNLRNAVIGQTDMSKFYNDKVSSDIFKVIHRLCELGLPTEVYLILIYVSLFASDGVELVDQHVVEKNQVETLFLLHRYLIHLYGCNIARMKLSQIMGVMVDLREVCDKSKDLKLHNKRN